MIVVADASPRNYLVQLDCDLLLPQLYEQVLVPEVVLDELRNRRAPSVVASWTANPPHWVEVCAVQDTRDYMLNDLDAGERSAIQLAQQRRGAVVLIDEYRGREVATRRGVQTIGTLGILLAASQRRIADGEAAFLKLLSTSFRISARVREDFAAKFAAIRKKATE